MTVIEMKEKFNEIFDQLIKEGKGDYAIIIHDYDHCNVNLCRKEKIEFQEGTIFKDYMGDTFISDEAVEFDNEVINHHEYYDYETCDYEERIKEGFISKAVRISFK